MKTPNSKPIIVLLALTMTGALAVSGCKKKAPTLPSSAPADASTAAPAPDAAAPAAPAQPEAAPAPAPTDSASTGAPVSVPLKDPNAFQSSDPKLEDLWNTAIAAAQTNGWATTYTSLMAIRTSSNLSSSQANVIDSSINTVGMAMYNAAMAGDQAAAAALSQVRRHHHQQ